METGESPDICWPASLAYTEENKKDPAAKKEEDKTQHPRLFSDLNMSAAACMSPSVYTETGGVMSAHTQILRKGEKKKRKKKNKAN